MARIFAWVVVLCMVGCVRVNVGTKDRENIEIAPSVIMEKADDKDPDADSDRKPPRKLRDK